MLVLAPAAMAASISTDKQDYEPGNTVTYTGSAFTAGEAVDLSATGSTNGTQISIQTTADANGCIIGSFGLPLMYEATYDLTATGATSGSEASVSFSDAVTGFDIVFPSSSVSLYAGDTQMYTVIAKTTGNNPVQGVTVNWTATGGTMLPTSSTTGGDGKTSSTYTAGLTPGTYTVTATAPGAGSTGGKDPKPVDKVASQEVTVLEPLPPADETPPVTTMTITSGTPGTGGWYVSDVVVTLAATDGGSGVAEIHYILNGGTETIVLAATTTFSITTEVTNTLDYWAIDNASNVEEAETETIKIDKTKPVVTITSPGPGCYQTAPDLVYSVVEANPGTVVPAGYSTDEGEHTVTVTATDAAGNVGSDSVTYTVDKTPPETEIALSGTVGNNSWYRSDVDVTLTATDNVGGSGVAAIYYVLDAGATQTYSAPFTIPSEGIHTLDYWAVDNVGNEETHHSQEIKIDKTPPTITGSRSPVANSYGWNNGNVTVHFTGSDSVSGIDTLTPDTVVSTEAKDQSVTGTAVDKAGNSASATVSEINIDKTKPVVTITAPTEGAEYLLNQNVSANWTATDTLSGIDSAIGTVPSGSPIPTGTVGANTFAVTATDKAGNAQTVTVNYYVRYNFIGFLPPVDNPPVGNVGQAGRTFPIKWQLKDASGKFISDLGVVLYNPLRYMQTIGGSPIWDDPIAGDTSGASGLRYDSASNQYIFTWQTAKSFAGNSYELLLELNDGTVHKALFKFKK